MFSSSVTRDIPGGVDRQPAFRLSTVLFLNGWRTRWKPKTTTGHTSVFAMPSVAFGMMHKNHGDDDSILSCQLITHTVRSYRRVRTAVGGLRISDIRD